MPFTLDDLDRIKVRVGMGMKSLRDMTDTQFTAWLRGQGARGDIGVISPRPGELVIPLEERLRVLNDLESEGFYIPEVMGRSHPAPGPDPALLARAHECVMETEALLHELDAIVAELGEIDPRVNMRASMSGALELIQLIGGAVEHARRQAGLQ
jgi:hypothetical protein